jgi:AGZA family xanthine/uracil permease-like MFS transporter
MHLMDRLFRLRERGTTIRIEILGGATTFVTMAYIIVLNPSILSVAVPKGPSTVATILAAVFGSLFMGLYANRPIAVAPYMGENAFIAFGLVLAQLVTFEQALGAVFISGAAFAVLTLLRVRSWLANSLSPSMKHSFVVGIGLFLLLIGLYQTGIVTSSVTGMPPSSLRVTEDKVLAAPDVPLKIGDLRDPRVLLALAGFLVTITLLYRGVRGAILLGIVLTAAAGYLLGEGAALKGVVAVPWSEEYDVGKIALSLDIAGVLELRHLPILLTLFLLSFLDTLGTLVGVGAAGNLLDEKGNFPEIEKPMLVDAAACMFGAAVGTSTSGAYIESATGIKEGARTGLAAVTVAVLFAAALFFIPLVEPLQELRFAYGSALMAVGVLMLPAAAKIQFDDLTEAAPAVATIAMMLFTYNIGNGLTAGLVLYPVLKFATGRYRDLSAGSVLLGVLCLAYYLFGLPH